MSTVPNGEILVETKQCRHCSVNFEITDKDLEFYEKVSPSFPAPLTRGDQGWLNNSTLSTPQPLPNQVEDKLLSGGLIKYLIPTPTLCPDCRQKRRLSFRNERMLYKRDCSATGKEIISIYSPEKKHKVYNKEIWWSDNWNPLDYGRDFDFSRSFFEQFGELVMDVPQLAILNTENENCDYNNFIKGCKDCYLSSVVYYGSEDIYYSNWVWSSKKIFDCFNINTSENCFDSMFLENCFNCYYLYNSYECSNCYFSKNLRGCKDCIMCSNLVNKQYYIENKQYSKEDFMSKLKEIFDRDVEDNKKYLQTFLEKQIVPYASLFNCTNCIGDNLKNSRNAQYCFDTYEMEDSKFLTSEKTKDSYDGIGGELELCYEFCRVGWGQRNLFCFDEIQSSFTMYCWSVYYSHDCFGCVGLRNKEYCIFNKQYTKEEYESLIPKIIEHMKKTGEWGEFFPFSLSPFGYNETVAIQFFPKSKEEAIEEGLNWSDYESPFPKVEKTISIEMMAKLPKNINEVPNHILNWALTCEITGKPFRLIKKELDFYHKHNLPIPKRHPDQRHLDRMKLRNPRKLYDRECQNPKCSEINQTKDGKPVEFKTTYSPERKEIVYCEECYNKEVY